MNKLTQNLQNFAIFSSSFVSPFYIRLDQTLGVFLRFYLRVESPVQTNSFSSEWGISGRNWNLLRQSRNSFNSNGFSEKRYSLQYLYFRNRLIAWSYMYKWTHCVELPLTLKRRGKRKSLMSTSLDNIVKTWQVVYITGRHCLKQYSQTYGATILQRFSSILLSKYYYSTEWLI